MAEDDCIPDCEIAALIASAEHGDRRAIRAVFRMAADGLATGKPIDMHPLVRAYLHGAFTRASDTESDLNRLVRCFAPMSKQPPAVMTARRAMQTLSVIAWCNRYRETLKLKTSANGAPGPLFEHVGAQFGLSAATVRNLYYRYLQSKNYRKTRKTTKKR